MEVGSWSSRCDNACHFDLPVQSGCQSGDPEGGVTQGGVDPQVPFPQQGLFVNGGEFLQRRGASPYPDQIQITRSCDLPGAGSGVEEMRYRHCPVERHPTFSHFVDHRSLGRFPVGFGGGDQVPGGGTVHIETSSGPFDHRAGTLDPGHVLLVEPLQDLHLLGPQRGDLAFQPEQFRLGCIQGGVVDPGSIRDPGRVERSFIEHVFDATRRHPQTQERI